jgi:hypothetical protein
MAERGQGRRQGADNIGEAPRLGERDALGCRKNNFHAGNLRDLEQKSSWQMRRNQQEPVTGAKGKV